MESRGKEYWLDKEIQLSDKEGYYGTPLRYWINQNFSRYIKKYCPDKNAIILDIGCGWGRYSEFFADLGIRGKYLGIDINRFAYWQDHVKNGFEIKYKELDVIRICDTGLRFNFAISITSLEHIKDDIKALREIKNTLFENSHVLVVAPSRFSLLLYGRKHGYRRYSRKSLLKLASESGMETIELIPIGGLASYIFFFIWTIPEKISFRIGRLLRIFFSNLKYKNIFKRTASKENIAFKINYSLDNLIWLHLKTRLGKSLHRLAIELCSILDDFLPIFEIGYLIIFMKRYRK